MLDSAAAPARLAALLGLATWRLRRDVARAAEQRLAAETRAAEVPAALKTDAVPQALAAPAAGAGAYAQAVQVSAQVRVWAADCLTLIRADGYGSWWLPALSARDAGMALFRSAAETDMLHAVLAAAGLDALSAHLRAVDAHFAAGGFLPRRLPPDREELLSLPKPWLLCGAIAQKQGAAAAGADAPLFLHHPLLLLTRPQQKRAAWQQILAYKQVIHV